MTLFSQSGISPKVSKSIKHSSELVIRDINGSVWGIEFTSLNLPFYLQRIVATYANEYEAIKEKEYIEGLLVEGVKEYRIKGESFEFKGFKYEFIPSVTK